MVHTGVCGFPKRHAVIYETVDAAEAQQPFYKPPQVKTVERWRAEAPADFAFTTKAWQLITHHPASPTYRRSGLDIDREDWGRYGYFRPTEEVWSAWERTLAVARGMQARVIVFQCPAAFTPRPENIQNLRQFFGRIERDGFILAWEPRGPAWAPEVVAELCRDLNLVHCVDPFTTQTVTPGLAYFRLHGRGGYDYQYTDGELDHLVRLCEAFDETWMMFNNTAMWEDALRFRSRLAPQPS